MMNFTFDLISDLHIESWPEPFDWSGRATSAYCVVAGDLAHDRSNIVQSLAHLGQCYQAVFYIDGNDEHRDHRHKLSGSYHDLVFRINTIPNVVYLQDNVVVVDGVAILGANGWWGYDFDIGICSEQVAQWYGEEEQLDPTIVSQIRKMSNVDAHYLINSVRKLQTHKDVKKIVMVSHTVPLPALIEHDIDLEGSMRFNVMGNRFMQHAIEQDTEKKIHTWCFGHYHHSVDQFRNGIRYVNNCRGRGNTPWSQWAYHPKRIVIDY
jgi:hypothetical protein